MEVEVALVGLQSKEAQALVEVVPEAVRPH